MSRFIITIFLIVAMPWIVLGQPANTVLSFQQAKARLMKKNLNLLASYYDINIADAQVIQARVWNNPYLIWNQDLYQVEKNQYFNPTNQALIQVEQIFSVAGKHTNTVKLAKINLEISKVQLEDVIRSLIFDLGETYNNLAALQEKQSLYIDVLTNYERLLTASREQLRVGAISKTEFLRLESEYVVEKAQAVEIYNSQQVALAHLKILLQVPPDSTLVLEQRTPLFSTEFILDSLIRQGIQSRPDLKVAKLRRAYQERNLKLQQSLSVPDFKLAYQPYDRGSNYTRPYSGTNLEVPLPMFDRNQGRIKAARYQLTQSEFQLELQKSTVSNEVIAAYNQYVKSNEGLANFDDEFIDDLQKLAESNNTNFKNRNISLLQFIDQQRIYIQTNLLYIELRQQYLDSVNELNFYIGKQLIDY